MNSRTSLSRLTQGDTRGRFFCVSAPGAADYSLQLTTLKVDCFLRGVDPGVIPLYGRPPPDMLLLLCNYA